MFYDVPAASFYIDEWTHHFRNVPRALTKFRPVTSPAKIAAESLTWCV
jgi:hypothetical protein